MIVFTSSGAENTSEINIPLESKYWYLENSLQFIAANSFIYSAEYTKPTVQEKNIRFSNYLNTTAIRSAIYTRDVVYNVYTTPWPSEY